MTVTIQVADDPNFKLVDVVGGLIEDIKPLWSPDVEKVVPKVEVVQPIENPDEVGNYPTPKPVPLNNHTSTDAGCWFGGTSWATK